MLIWNLIGWPCFLGVLTVVVGQGINALVTRVLLKRERQRRTVTDDKLQKVTEFVEGIRHLRWHGWQELWRDRIMKARQDELNLRIITSLWAILISFINTLASGMFPVAAFFAYTAFAGQPLRIDVAFPALQLFTMLESRLRDIPDLITVLLNAKVAIDRIEDFLGEEDIKDKSYSVSKASRLAVINVSFSWPGTHHPVLQDVSISFPVGLTVIYGKVAAGKTALLQALLGELDVLSGHYIRPNAMLGYCAQTPWLQSMSIRDNIIFTSAYEDARYKAVLEACALTPDLAFFKDGDRSNIGENGIGLSGGQKARVALARAVYSRAEFLLLDDPLSALDHQTAARIVRNCLGGHLLEGRTAILVTHRTDLCHGLAKQIVEISDGRARVVDSSAASVPVLARVEPSESDDSMSHVPDGQQEVNRVPTKFIEEEHRAHGMLYS